MGPWGPKMGVPPKKAPIFKEDAFPYIGGSLHCGRRPGARGVGGLAGIGPPKPIKNCRRQGTQSPRTPNILLISGVGMAKPFLWMFGVLKCAALLHRWCRGALEGPPR